MRGYTAGNEPAGPAATEVILQLAAFVRSPNKSNGYRYRRCKAYEFSLWRDHPTGVQPGQALLDRPGPWTGIRHVRAHHVVGIGMSHVRGR